MLKCSKMCKKAGLKCFFQSVFIQSVFLQNVPHLRVFQASFKVYINLGTGVGKEEKNVEFAHKKVFQKIFKNVLWKLFSWKLLDR